MNMAKTTSNSALTALLAILLAGTVVLSGVMATTVTKITRQSTIESTMTIAQSQLSAVEEFVKKQESRLLDYSRAEEIKRLLTISVQMETADDAQKAELQEAFEEARVRVQKYMEDVSVTPDEGGVDEGVYVSTWHTYILAHTNVESTNLYTRQEGSDSQKALQKALLEAGDNGVYNTGIILSPVGDHAQIVSLYKGVFDEAGEPIGLVGMGVYTEQLEKALGFKLTGMPHAKFSMVNVKDTKYIFKEGDEIKHVSVDESGNKSYEYKSTDNQDLIQLCKQYQANAPIDNSGQYEFGKSVAVYAYSQEYGWLFQIEDLKSEMYNAEGKVRSFMFLFLGAIAVVAGIIFLLNRKMLRTSTQLVRSIEKQEKTKRALTDSMDKDVLTQAKSRLSFIEEYSQVQNTERVPAYFVLHSFHDLSRLNMRFGIDTVDNFIIDFAQQLFAQYGKQNVYRTSNKEFVCVISDDNIGTQEIQANVRTLHSRLTGIHKNPDGSSFTPVVDSAIVKQMRSNNLNVLPILKEIAREKRPISTMGIPFVDLDKAQ